MKSVYRLTGTIAAAIVSFAVATAAIADGSSRFAEQEAAFQKNSRSSASGSPRVDKTAKAADPVPKATTKEERKSRFAAQESAFQRASRSTASGSTRVDKSVAAADPIAKVSTKSERKARFSQQEERLQEQSTP